MPTLHWLTRDTDIHAAARVPYRLLEEAAELSAGEPDAGNMVIQGDNLEALKALLAFYAGQVKCIYIDPPYNTRSAFEHYDDNLEHSKWLAMMWPRLELLRDLLAEDGSIWVSIDDNEAHYLKVVMDEIFGRRNFVANVFWQKTFTRENRTDVSAVHDHIMLFARDREVWKEIRHVLPASESQLERFTNPDNDPRGAWSSLPAHAKAEKGRRKEQFFTVTTPSGRTVDPPAGRCWLYTEERFAEMVADNRIWFGSEGANVPRVKKFLSEVQQGLVPSTLWLYQDVGTTGEAKNEITGLFPGETPFSTPKPERLLQRILHIATSPGDLVLDSFLGSGTGGGGAQDGPPLHRHRNGRPRRQPLRPAPETGHRGRTGRRLQERRLAGGGGFRFYRLGPPVFDAAGQIRADVPFPVLAAHVYFSETGRPWRGNGASPFLGLHDGRAYALLYNGILGDRRADGGNVLTRATLSVIRQALTRQDAGFDGPLTVYGERSRLMPATLDRQRVTFKQAPYHIKAWT